MNPTNAPMPLCESALTTSLNADHGEQILKGLYRGGVGFLIAPPESGKSYTVLSMAYEPALPHSPFLGLRPSNSTTYKTLLWPMEDAGLGLYPRLLRHLANFSQQTKACLKDNISLFQQSYFTGMKIRRHFQLGYPPAVSSVWEGIFGGETGERKPLGRVTITIS